MKTETAAQREEKIKELARKVTGHCSKFYDTATEEQKEKLFALLEDLETAMVEYRHYERSWDSSVIPVTQKIGDVRFRTSEFSTFESVMDKARDVIAFIGTGN